MSAYIQYTTQTHWHKIVRTRGKEKSNKKRKETKSDKNDLSFSPFFKGKSSVKEQTKKGKHLLGTWHHLYSQQDMRRREWEEI